MTSGKPGSRHRLTDNDILFENDNVINKNWKLIRKHQNLCNITNIPKTKNHSY